MGARLRSPRPLQARRRLHICELSLATGDHSRQTEKDDMTQTDPIELYYWPTPNGWKITIFMEETGTSYTVKYVNIGRGEQFAPDFLAIAPNNRMPAIIDPEGPDGQPISIFESGAILLYLGRKTGQFYPAEERARVEVEQWLMWQMGNFGPMLGQNHHFRNYADERLDYAVQRYENEADRLYGVLDARLADREFIAGDYSIADMAIVGWARGHARQGVAIHEFPNVSRWLDMMLARPAVQRGIAVGKDRRVDLATDAEAKKVLFNQRARRAS